MTRPRRRLQHAVQLDFTAAAGEPDHLNLSGAACSGPWLWVVGDEQSAIERLRLQPGHGPGGLHYAERRRFDLHTLLDLPAADTDEADLEGLAQSDGWLWLVGSHGHKRSKAEGRGEHERDAAALSRVSLDGNRRLLARIPLEPDDNGAPQPVARARDGRRAQRLKGGARRNPLTDLLAADPHYGPLMQVPGKDNGVDIEGIAVMGERVLLGLRGPVLRGWAGLLELALEPGRRRLKLKALDDAGTLLRKHFLSLDGLGVRDLHVDGDDLYLLAGPTMALDGDIRVYRWTGALPDLRGNRRPVRFVDGLVESLSLPHGRGTDRAEAFCEVPAEFVGGRQAWLVLYDAPGPARLPQPGRVLGDLLLAT